MKKSGNVLYYVLGLAFHLLLFYSSGIPFHPICLLFTVMALILLVAIRHFVSLLHTDILILTGKAHFTPVDVVVSDIGSDSDSDSFDGYYIRVTPVNGDPRERIIPERRKYFKHKEDAQRLLGSHLTLYAREPQMKILYYEEDTTKSGIIKHSIVIIICILAFLFFSIPTFWISGG
ncbi:MAG: hypothetical protein ACI4M3_00245 [Acutalibacteraceae bacterium]